MDPPDFATMIEREAIGKALGRKPASSLVSQADGAGVIVAERNEQPGSRRQIGIAAIGHCRPGLPPVTTPDGFNAFDWDLPHVPGSSEGGHGERYHGVEDCPSQQKDGDRDRETSHCIGTPSPNG